MINLLTLNDRLSGIYCIENLITHKRYIGQSNNMYSRQTKHINELRKNKHENDYLQKAWNKYGENNFNFYVLEYCDIDMLDNKECYYIDLYNTLNRDLGYNLTEGGQLNKGSYSKETIEKMSNSIKKSYNSELKEKRSQQLKEQWANPEIREKLSRGGMNGRHHTDKVKEKLRELHKGTQIARKYFEQVLCVESGVIYQNASIAAKELSLDASCIIKVCKGERHTCGKMHWKFIT